MVIMNNIDSAGSRVIPLRKIVVNPSTASAANLMPVATAGAALTATQVQAGAPFAVNFISNGMITSGSTTVALTSASNGLLAANANNGLILTANPGTVVTNGQSVQVVSTVNNPGIITTGGVVNNGVSNNSTNGIVQSVGMLNGAIRPQQNGRVMTAPVLNGSTVPVQQGTGTRLTFTPQQLQLLLESKLAEQSSSGTSQRQIIRLSNPQQQLLRLQQPQQVIRVQSPTQQIIRIPSSQICLPQGTQLPDGRIVMQQPLQLSQAQLQHIHQQLQEKQQTVAIQPLQLQNQIQTTQNNVLVQPTQPALVPGVQVVSISSAQAALLQQQKVHQQSNSLARVTVAASSLQTKVPEAQMLLQGQPQAIVPSTSAPVVSSNGLAPSLNSVIEQATPVSGHSTQNGQLNSHSTALTEVTPTTVLSAENQSALTAPKHLVQTVDLVDDDDDDDIKEIGQVIKKGNKTSCSTTQPKAENNFNGNESLEESEPGVIDIVINNVVCSFSVGCHIDLRELATIGYNVEYRRENGMVTMKLRRPLTTASIWSSGKITCTGSTSEAQARVAARRIARCLQKLGCNARFRNFRVVNVLGTCSMPFAIKITPFSKQHQKAASYEPELHPGVTYRIDDPKATLKIFSTGSITVTAPSVANVQAAIEHIYPLVSEFSKERTPEEEARRQEARFADYGMGYLDEDCGEDHRESSSRVEKVFGHYLHGDRKRRNFSAIPLTGFAHARKRRRRESEEKEVIGLSDEDIEEEEEEDDEFDSTDSSDIEC